MNTTASPKPKQYVMIGSFRFRSIGDAHRFLADGGSSRGIPTGKGWNWWKGCLIKMTPRTDS